MGVEQSANEPEAHAASEGWAEPDNWWRQATGLVRDHSGVSVPLLVAAGTAYTGWVLGLSQEWAQGELADSLNIPVEFAGSPNPIAAAAVVLLVVGAVTLIAASLPKAWDIHGMTLRLIGWTIAPAMIVGFLLPAPTLTRRTFTALGSITVLLVFLVLGGMVYRAWARRGTRQQKDHSEGEINAGSRRPREKLDPWTQLHQQQDNFSRRGELAGKVVLGAVAVTAAAVGFLFMMSVNTTQVPLRGYWYEVSGDDYFIVFPKDPLAAKRQVVLIDVDRNQVALCGPTEIVSMEGLKIERVGRDVVIDTTARCPDNE